MVLVLKAPGSHGEQLRLDTERPGEAVDERAPSVAAEDPTILEMPVPWDDHHHQQQPWGGSSLSLEDRL